MPATATRNYAEVVRIEARYDFGPKTGQIKATYVVGYLDPGSGAITMQTGTAVGASVVVSFVGAATMDATYVAVREAIRAQEGYNFSATPPDQVVLPSGTF